jgi:Eukaryotic elongation factor 5A hypusine, DNA-binding OB fold
LIHAAESRPLKVNIDDGFLNLMTPDGTAKDDVRVPEGDLGTSISSGFDEGKDLLVTIISAMGEEQVSFSRSHWLGFALIGLPGYLVQRSPERLLDSTLAYSSVFLVSPWCTCPLRPSIYRPYGCHSCCACTFHGLIQHVYCIVLSSGVAMSVCMD